MVIVDALGKRVANAQQVDQLRQRILSQPAPLFQVHHQTTVFNDEGFENALVIVLRKPAEIRVAAEIIEKIGADRTSDDVGGEGVVAANGANDLILNTLAF